MSSSDSPQTSPSASAFSAAPAAPPLRILAWEITRRCSLGCRHCRAASEDRRYEGELSTEECFRFLDKLASFARPIVILTGGEPMAREDFLEIVRYGAALGLPMAAAPCGLLMTPENTRAMKAAGVRRISLSIDGADAASHDAFRGVPGAFEGVLRAAQLAREAGLEFQVNTTVTTLNAGQLDSIYSLARELGAVSFHPFLLVPTGRGEALKEMAVDARTYEKLLHWFYDKSREGELHIKPTCAPHYYRVMRQREAAEGRAVTRESHGMSAMTRGCLGGHGFAFLSHTGKAQICGFLDQEAGDLRAADYDFHSIWTESPLYRRVRAAEEYRGRCGVCEYHAVCGGCRARAYAVEGDAMASEPYCLYTPAAMREAGDE